VILVGYTKRPEAKYAPEDTFIREGYDRTWLQALENLHNGMAEEVLKLMGKWWFRYVWVLW
jgi:hypothetical protein